MFQENNIEGLRRWSLASMTGMGSSVISDDVSLECTIRSVNQKGLDIKCRLSANLSHLEPLVISTISKRLRRGRIEVALSINEIASQVDSAFDRNKAHSWLRVLNDFYDDLEGVLPLSMGDLLSLPGVITAKERGAQPKTEEMVKKALSEALDALVASRLREGLELSKSLKSMIDHVETLLSEIRAHRDQDVNIRFIKLKSRCDELFSGYNLSQERIYQEGALLAERSDFTEELDRLSAHVGFFGNICESEDGKGRKLDFLCQEMLRESNTLVSKAFEHKLVVLGIELKAEIEKIREQVQNIE